MKKGTGNNARRIVLFAISPAMELDIVGPMSVFASVNQIFGKSDTGYEMELITSEPGLAITGPLGLSFTAHRHYLDIRADVDTLLVVGGSGVLKCRDDKITAWLCKMAHKVRRLGSVCTGSFLLAEAGLLNGKHATTHWAWIQELASRYPEVIVDSDPIWVKDGKIYTSAGVTAGMDLSLGFVEDDYGSDMALKVARDLVLFLRRPGGQSQFSTSLSVQASGKKALFELQIWMSENLHRELSVETLASRVSMSPRNFARVFVRELAITPARYVEKLRIEAARRHLEQKEKSLAEVANLCGFGTAELMRRVFIRMLGISPGRYRDHFGSSFLGVLPGS